MKLALIPPTGYLAEFACYRSNDYHMALAQRVLADKKYSEFYTQRSGAGDYVILDNGACELKESVDFNQLIEAIYIIKPNVVVLPDKLGDTKTTIRLSMDFLNLYKNQLNEKVVFMAVVQGKSKNEWIECFNFFSNHKDISNIGISNTEAIYKSTPEIPGRVKTLNFLKKMGILNQNKKIHLLGLPDSGNLELQKMKKYQNIEGVDTSGPIVHGAEGMIFETGIPYIKIRHYLDNKITLNKVQISNIKHNIDILFEAIS